MVHRSTSLATAWQNMNTEVLRQGTLAVDRPRRCFRFGAFVAGPPPWAASRPSRSREIVRRRHHRPDSVRLRERAAGGHIPVRKTRLSSNLRRDRFLALAIRKTFKYPSRSKGRQGHLFCLSTARFLKLKSLIHLPSNRHRLEPLPESRRKKHDGGALRGWGKLSDRFTTQADKRWSAGARQR